ncbi:MAG: hypothetical protein JWM87_706 [Candidatus Eremiobacteraeota bacterium]|nr:hypothetical protein [Candidatus Eremiobacteraeota bacterium]
MIDAPVAEGDQGSMEQNAKRVRRGDSFSFEVEFDGPFPAEARATAQYRRIGGAAYKFNSAFSVVIGDRRVSITVQIPPDAPPGLYQAIRFYASAGAGSEATHMEYTPTMLGDDAYFIVEAQAVQEPPTLPSPIPKVP